jgi:hypothetical protein
MLRWVRLALVPVGIVAALGFAAGPAQGRIGPEVSVIDSNAVAASIGVISRVPAESAGGINWTSTAITLDKAVAKAAGATPGELAEGFFHSSSDQYRNPSLIGAQYPPTAIVPAEARGGSPPGVPGGVAATHVVATEQPSADAEAQGGRGGDGSPIVMQGGTSSSHGELSRDGAVITRARSVASGIAIGAGAVTLTSATTEAVTTVPPRGRPTTEVKVTLTGLLVGGVPAELTDEGLRISDQVPVGPGQLAAFNAATAQLAARGIVVTAAPVVREVGIDRARAEGGGVVVRYTVTDQFGGDEEVVLAEARSRSTLGLAEAAPAPPLPSPPGETPVTVPPVVVAPPAPQPLAAPPVGTGAAGVGSSLSDTSASPGPAAGAPTDIAAGPVPVAAEPLPLPRPALNLPGGEDDRALNRLRSGYRVILLLAAAGAAAHIASQRSRTS